jgi:PD-(D/E)XK endonuclease
LIQVGHQCLIPWGHDHRYDIAIDDDGKLVRIQCKTARYIEKSGCLQFNTAITYARVGGKPHIRKGYKGEADYFGVYSPDTGKVYLVPIEDVPHAEAVFVYRRQRTNSRKASVGRRIMKYKGGNCEIKKAGGRDRTDGRSFTKRVLYH